VPSRRMASSSRGPSPRALGWWAQSASLPCSVSNCCAEEMDATGFWLFAKLFLLVALLIAQFPAADISASCSLLRKTSPLIPTISRI
jgi:hypothetical protein